MSDLKDFLTPINTSQFKPLEGYSTTLDTTKTKLFFQYVWPEAKRFYLIIKKDAFIDTANNSQLKNDTIAFRTAALSDYGSIAIRFTGVDISQNPVLQIVQGDNIIQAFKLTQDQFNIKLFPPGTYEMRILYDKNKNGKWDTGNYWLRKQPEKVIAIDRSFNVRANWDNEFTINLSQ